MNKVTKRRVIVFPLIVYLIASSIIAHYCYNCFQLSVYTIIIFLLDLALKYIQKSY